MMRIRGSDRWKTNWRVVAPSGSVRIDVGDGEGRAQAERLAARTSVVLVASGRRGGARLRSFAEEAGIELDREYLAFPSADAAAYLVENDPATAKLFVKNVLAAPPNASFALRMGVSLFRRLGTPAALAALAPGRIVVGKTA
jgi:hypothetical protein